MAKTCSPFNNQPNFMSELEKQDPDGWITGAINHQVKAGRVVLPREGFDAAMSKMIVDEMARIGNMPPDAIVDWVRAKGWLTDTGKLGAELGKGDNSAFAVGFLRTYTEGSTTALRELGNAFLAKANNGFDATVEGMKFAQQLKAISKIGEVVLGINQQAGRTVRVNQRRIREGSRAAQQADRMLQSIDEDFVRQEGFTDVMSEIAQNLKDPTKSAAAINRLVDLATQVQFVDSPDKIARATMGLREIGSNVVAEYMVNSLLSSPATMGAAASGAIWVPLRAMLTLAGSPVLAFAGGGEAAYASAQASMASLAAMRQSFSEAMALGWHAFKTEQSVYQKVRTPGIKAYGSDPAVQKIAAAQGDEFAQTVVSSVNAIGSFTRWPSRILLGVDEAARHMASRAEVAQRGVINAFRDGIDLGDNAAIRGRVTQEFEDAFRLQTVAGKERRAGINNIYEMTSQQKFGGTVEQYAARGTFQEDNGLAQLVSGLLDKAPFFKPFLPFVKTPLNILNQGLMVGQTRTALGALVDVGVNGTGDAAARVLQLQQRMLKDPQEAALYAGQIGFTTGMAVVGYQLATQTDEEGRQILSGGGPSRWMSGSQGMAAQRAWEMAGNQRYSFRYGPGADQVVPFDRFGEPFATVLRMITDVGTVSAFLDDEEKDTTMAAIASVMATGLYNSSFLSSFGNFMDLVFAVDEPRYFDKMFAGNVRSYINTFTPMGGLLGYVERLDDPYRAAYEPGSTADLFGSLEQMVGNGILANAAKRIPGNALPAQHDQILGEPIPIYPGMGPEGISAAEMAVPLFPRLQDKANPAVKAWTEVAGPYRMYVPHGRGQSDFQLTPQEQKDLAIAMSQVTIRGKTFAEAIMDIRNRPEVQAYLARRGTRYGKLNSEWADEMNELRTRYGEAAYTSIMTNSETLTIREAKRSELNEAKKGSDGTKVLQLQDQLRELYDRARYGG